MAVVVPSCDVHLCSDPCSNDILGEKVCRRHRQLAEELETLMALLPGEAKFCLAWEPHGEGETLCGWEKE